MLVENKTLVYEQAECFLCGNECFKDGYAVRRFLDKYIDDICRDITETADYDWSVDDVILAVQRVMEKKLEIED